MRTIRPAIKCYPSNASVIFLKALPSRGLYFRVKIHPMNTAITPEIAEVLKAAPVVVAATERVLGHFRKLTRHTGVIFDYIPGNYEEATVPELRKLTAPYNAGWEKIKQEALLTKLEKAATDNMLASGIDEIQAETANKNCRLLVVEKNYRLAARPNDAVYITDALPVVNGEFSYLRDAVDDVIRTVLMNGGDVEFVDDDKLSDYNHIATGAAQ